MARSKQYGRPQYVDSFTDKHWSLLDKLLMLPRLACSNECILAMMQEMPDCGTMSMDVLEKIIKNKYGATFAETRIKKGGILKSKIIEKQIQMALSGDRVMSIWVGKQYCGQRDNPEPDDTEPPFEYPKPGVSDVPVVSKPSDDI